MGLSGDWLSYLGMSGASCLGWDCQGLFVTAGIVRVLVVMAGIVKVLVVMLGS